MQVSVTHRHTDTLLHAVRRAAPLVCEPPHAPPHTQPEPHWSLTLPTRLCPSHTPRSPHADAVSESPVS